MLAYYGASQSSGDGLWFWVFFVGSFVTLYTGIWIFRYINENGWLSLLRLITYSALVVGGTVWSFQCWFWYGLFVVVILLGIVAILDRAVRKLK
jgi:hypothetical protein